MKKTILIAAGVVVICLCAISVASYTANAIGGDEVSSVAVEYEVWNISRTQHRARGFYVHASGALVFYGDDMQPIAAYAAGEWKSVGRKAE